MRILIFYQLYLQAVDSGGSRFNQFAKYWADAGHEVTVITGQTNYHTGHRPSRYHGALCIEEQDGKVRVLRAYTPSNLHKGWVGRALYSLSFMLSASWATLRKKSAADVIIASSPPLTVAIPGILASSLYKAPMIFEVRDLWPESAVALGVLEEGSLIVKLLYFLERLAYRKAVVVNVLTPAMREDLLRRNLKQGDQIACIPNAADLDLFDGQGEENGRLRAEVGWREDDFVVLYTGAHGVAQYIEQLLDAAELLQREVKIRLVTLGDGARRSWLIQEAQRRQLHNVQLIGAVPKKDMPMWIKASDVGLAMLKPALTNETVYPTKIFDYMACRKPTLVMIGGIARKLIEEAKGGFYVEPGNPQQLAEAILYLRDHPEVCRQMGNNGRAYVERHFSRYELAQGYEEILRRVAETYS